MLKIKVIFTIALISSLTGSFAQTQIGGNTEKVIDRIVGTIGDEIILQSDVDQQKMQLEQQGMYQNQSNCELLEELMMNKILLNQAKKDSLEINEAQVKAQVNAKVCQLLMMFGGYVDKLEKYYGQSIDIIKQELEPLLEQQMLIGMMQQSITTDITCTPREVKSFYNKIPVDSLPYIDSRVEYGALYIFPDVTVDDQLKTKKELEGIRSEIIGGLTTFETAAYLNSQDPGSAQNGGDLGWNERGTMVPKFESHIFSLQEGEISPVFLTQFGFHIIQLIERRGNMYRARHILLKPTYSSASLLKAGKLLDSLKTNIETGVMTFEQAVNWYSKKYEPNGSGIVANPGSKESGWAMTELDDNVKPIIQSMQVGGVSPIGNFEDQRGGKKGLRIIVLLSKTKPHVATLSSDYEFFVDATLGMKRQERLKEWLDDVLSKTLIVIKDPYLQCEFKYKWLRL